METLHHIMSLFIQFSIIFLELTGVVVLLTGAIKAIISYIKHAPHTRLNLCKAMAMALEFKLGGEILRTVIVREFSEIVLVGCIIVLRAGLTFLIHWAINAEEAEENEQYEKQADLKQPQPAQGGNDE